jgi:hypothetical protein
LVVKLVETLASGFFCSHAESTLAPHYPAGKMSHREKIIRLRD